MGRRLIDLAAQLDALLADLATAGATGADESTVARIIADIDACEDKQRRQDAYLIRKQADASKVSALVASGMDELEARATVTGKTVDALRKADFIAQARSDGYTGAGFDALLTDKHRDMVTALLAQAQDYTKGYMVRGDKTATGYAMWFCSDARVTATATDELLEWFAANGRLTRAQLRAQVLSERVHVGSIGR